MGGWIGLVKYQVWDASRLSHIPHKPIYQPHPSIPVRRFLWRPGYECEFAIVLNEDFGKWLGERRWDQRWAGASPDFTGGSRSGLLVGLLLRVVLPIYIAFADSHILWAQNYPLIARCYPESPMQYYIRVSLEKLGWVGVGGKGAF
ncbi:hypothetical protein PILCRDRAFT_253371 [Piloderma croceum F 1598]|uniref:Uncharacterized protein n=1 Tax=Piloderma croceum (strain F 1598) TaxID=765440 RepID=A0A0C3G955_PILCF|nr:hypothetical protein PILCRDRAFT_253371 [Piloderma croceum F 1598]